MQQCLNMIQRNTACIQNRGKVIHLCNETIFTSCFLDKAQHKAWFANQDSKAILLFFFVNRQPHFDKYSYLFTKIQKRVSKKTHQIP